MRKVSFGLVCSLTIYGVLLTMLHRAFYVLYYKHNTLTSTHDMLVTLISYCYCHFTITQSRMYILCHSITHVHWLGV